MGEVYRATDTNLKRQVAIKVLPASVAADPDRLARFQREAEILAALNHPNIAHIHGLEKSDRTVALVMELVEGPTLADRIAHGAIPVDEAVSIAKQIADALETAHEQGIIHRDLKPANIKVRDDDTVKLLDFGLAKAMDPVGTRPDVSQSPTITTPAMTQAGIILGTAAYMSPEQAKGRPADKRSDIWAFGCVFYEMLTGRRAFDGEDVSDTLAAVLRGQPDWTALPRGVPEPVRLVLQRCLDKDRSKRLSDICTVRFLMTEPALSVGPHGAAMPAPEQRVAAGRRVATIISAVVFGAAMLGVTVREFRPSLPRPIVTRFTFRLPEGQRFTNVGRQLVALSPDGTHMAYVANQRIYLRATWEFEATPIGGVGLGGLSSPVFSPDGQWIAYWSAGNLSKLAISGGAPIRLCEVDNPYGLSWAGDSLLLGDPRGVLRVSDQGGKPDVIIPVKENEIAHGPQLLPDGRSVLFTLAAGTAPDRWDNAQIVVQVPGSTERKTIISGGADARYVATGHVVYAVGGVLFAEPFDIRRLKTRGGPISVVEGVGRATVGSTGTAQFAVSQSGALMYLSGPATVGQPGYDVALLDRNGTLDRIKRLPPHAYQSPRFSPNGQQLAYDIDDGPAANVWVYDLGKNHAPRQLTLAGNNRFPIWTRDGQRIAFESDREGDASIFWQRADGSGQAERLTKAEWGEAHIPDSWSPDGDTLLFSSRTGPGQFLLRTVTLHENKIAPFDDVRSTAEPNSTFSPNGRWVAYSVQTSGSTSSKPTVYVRPLPLTDVFYRIGDGLNPFWSADGKTRYFVPSPGASAFSVVNITTEPSFDASEPSSVLRPIITGGGPIVPRAYDVAPNNQQFVVLVASGSEGADPQIKFVLNWTEELKQRVPTK
jgi:serine/threonine-protein kinase